MIDPIELILWTLIITVLLSAVYAIETRDLLSSVVVSGIVGLFASIVFLLLQAPDVAITQASIGAGLAMAVFLYALKNTERWEQ